MKLVLTHDNTPGHDDMFWERYQFSASYLDQMERAIGDLAIYFEPRRGTGPADRGRPAYIAVARVTSVTQDPSRADSYFAELDSFLEFQRIVPARRGSRYFEHGLVTGDGTPDGERLARRVRPIPAEEFEAIVQAGFLDENEDELATGPGLREAASPYDIDLSARLVNDLPLRQRVFSANVMAAYGQRCALTGLDLADGSGPDGAALHIQPLEEGGIDGVCNGLALSAPAYDAFDSGEISLAPDGTMLLAGPVPSLLVMLNRSGKANLPSEPQLRPAASFVRYHRQHVFKGRPH